MPYLYLIRLLRDDTFSFLRVCLHKTNSKFRLYLGKVVQSSRFFLFRWYFFYLDNAENMLDVSCTSMPRLKTTSTTLNNFKKKGSILNHLQRTGWCRLSDGVITWGERINISALLSFGVLVITFYQLLHLLTKTWLPDGIIWLCLCFWDTLASSCIVSRTPWCVVIQ